MNLYCIGINHRTAPIEVREKIWFSNEEARLFLTTVGKNLFDESVLISTCNRTELYYIPRGPVSNEQPLWRTLASYKNLSDGILDRHFYTLHALHAVTHLLKLASGIDSMVLGDVQILNQIKTAFTLAQESQTLGPILNRLFSTAMHTGKRARAETGIGDGAVSIGYAAAELVSKIFDNLSTKTALLIGAGETGKLTAQHLCGHHLGQLFVTNRTRGRAEALSMQLNGTVIDFDLLKDYLPRVDIVVSSVAAPVAILGKEDFLSAIRHRDTTPLVVIDLGMPRNIDCRSGDIENLFLHDIDSLNHIVDKNLTRRRAEIPKVHRIVLEEGMEFHRWHNTLEVVPTIQQLRERFEEIRHGEVDKYHHHFSPDLEEEVGILTKRIVNKILHAPMVNLRSDLSNEERQNHISLLRSLFGLDTEREIVYPRGKIISQ